MNHWTNVIWPNLHIHMHRKWFAWTIFHRNWILSTMLPSLLNFRICFLYSFENFECFDFSEFHLTTDISTLDRKKYTATAKSSFADIELNSLFLSAYGHNTAYTNIIYIIISPINSRISCQRSLWSILIFRFRQQFYEAKSSTLFPNCFFLYINICEFFSSIRYFAVGNFSDAWIKYSLGHPFALRMHLHLYESQISFRFGG